MEDFATFCKNQPSLFSRIFSLKMSKDRFWNLMFLILTVSGWMLTFCLNNKHFSFITSWLTIIGVPVLVHTFSKTTFVKDKTFLNSEGRELNWDKDLPNGFLTIVTTVALTALTGTILDKTSDPISDIFSRFIFITVLFGIPSLFFIFKDCPISVLFNRKLLSYIAANAPKSTLRRKDTYTDPSYSFLSHNMFHRKK